MLNSAADIHFSGGFFFKGFVAGAAEQDAVAEVAKIIEAFIVVEAAFEAEIVDGGGYDDLSAGRNDIQLGEQVAGKSVGADEELFCVKADVLLTVGGGDISVESEAFRAFLEMGDGGGIQNGNTKGLNALQELLAEHAGVKISFKFILDEVAGVAEAELFDLFAGEFVSGGRANDGSELFIEPVDLLLEVGLAGIVVMGNELIPFAPLEADGLLSEDLTGALEAAEAHVNQLEHMVFAGFIAVGDQFSNTAETGKAGIAGGGTGGDDAAVEDGDAAAGIGFLQVPGAPEANEAAAEDDHIGGSEKTFLFPDRYLH